MNPIKSGRGVVYLCWGPSYEPLLRRSIDSLAKFHPELAATAKPIELKEGATLKSKSGMYDLSPFAETLFLDIDTVVMGDLRYGFEMAGRHGLACCICECPWMRRYGAQYADMVEYNTGVLFFTEKAKPVFDTWRRLSATMDSAIRFRRDNRIVTMPENDQAGFSAAVNESGITPFILPQNWNYRPEWQKSYFGPLKVWHDRRPVPASAEEFNREQAASDSIIDYRELTWDAPNSVPLKLEIAEKASDGYIAAGAYPIHIGAQQIPESSCGEIVAHNVLHKYPPHKIPGVLADWARALRPGGILRVSMPDAACVATGMILNFNRESLRCLLIGAGLRTIRSDKDRPGEICLSAIKPHPTKVKNTVAVLSAPTYGPIKHVQAALDAFHALGVKYEIDGGPYWHQTMANLLEGTSRAYDFIITCDYDSLFIEQNIRDLYRIMQDSPNVDALATIELRREDGAPLLSMLDARGNRIGAITREEVDKDVVPIHSGHFGLTIIRAEALRRLPHPWFVGKPGPNGRWDSKRIDPDVMFWHHFADCGFKLCAAPSIGIGHEQRVATWADDDFKVYHQPLSGWASEGVPLKARQ